MWDHDRAVVDGSGDKKGWRKGEEYAEGRPTFDIERNKLDMLYNSGAHVELSAISKLHVYSIPGKRSWGPDFYIYNNTSWVKMLEDVENPRQMWAEYINVERLV